MVPPSLGDADSTIEAIVASLALSRPELNSGNARRHFVLCMSLREVEHVCVSSHHYGPAARDTWTDYVPCL